MNFNKVIIGGHLTRDPETQTLPSGNTITKLGIAVNKRYKGEDKTSFFEVVFFGATGEAIATFFKKGRAILIDGELQQDRWETDDGQKRSKVYVLGWSFSFVDKKEEQPETPTAAPESPTPVSSEETPADPNDPIPF